MGQRHVTPREDQELVPSKHSTNARQVHPTSNPNATLWADMVPQSWRPFVQLTRIDMIAGSLLMFWPSTWGILASAYRTRLDPLALAIELPMAFIGSVVLHSAACTWNDVCDKDFDAKVERTKYRPLAAGTVSVFAAMIFLVPQLAVIVGLLLLTNRTAFEIGAMGLCLWQPIYPLMKRITYWPQAWLGFVMNWGMIIAWITNTGSFDAKIVSVLFFGSCCWTLHYDSTYAMQDKDDDVKAGVKSTAVLFGKYARPILSLFCVGFIASLAYFGVLNGHGPAYFALTVLGTALHLLWQVSTLDMNNPKSCFAKFDANGRHVGFIVASGMAVDYTLRVLV